MTRIRMIVMFTAFGACSQALAQAPTANFYTNANDATHSGIMLANPAGNVSVVPPPKTHLLGGTPQPAAANPTTSNNNTDLQTPVGSEADPFVAPQAPVDPNAHNPYLPPSERAVQP